MLRQRPDADRVPRYLSDAGRRRFLGAALVARGGRAVGGARPEEEVRQLLLLQGAAPDQGAGPAALDDVLDDLLGNLELREVLGNGDLRSELLVAHVSSGGVEGGWRVEKIFEETSKPVPALRLKEVTPRAKMNALKLRILP